MEIKNFLKGVTAAAVMLAVAFAAPIRSAHADTFGNGPTAAIYMPSLLASSARSGNNVVTTNGSSVQTAARNLPITNASIGFNRSATVFLDITVASASKVTGYVQGRTCPTCTWATLPGGRFITMAGTVSTQVIALPGPLPQEIRGQVVTNSTGAWTHTLSMYAILGG